MIEIPLTVQKKYCIHGIFSKKYISLVFMTDFEISALVVDKSS